MERSTLSSGGAAPQHLAALAHANRVRLARAVLKRRVASGELAAREVVLACPWEAETMAIADLLTSQRSWGGTRCRRALAAISVTENKAIGSMTARQRAALVARLGHGGEAASEPDLG